MIDLHLIGIGTGNPDHLTRAAIVAMNAADLILLPRKGDAKSDLIDLRRGICAEVLTGATRVVEFDLPERDTTALLAENVGHPDQSLTWSTIAELASRLAGGVSDKPALILYGSLMAP